MPIPTCTNLVSAISPWQFEFFPLKSHLSPISANSSGEIPFYSGVYQPCYRHGGDVLLSIKCLLIKSNMYNCFYLSFYLGRMTPVLSVMRIFKYEIGKMDARSSMFVVGAVLTWVQFKSFFLWFCTIN